MALPQTKKLLHSKGNNQQNENTTYQSLLDAAKTVLRGKLENKMETVWRTVWGSLKN